MREEELEEIKEKIDFLINFLNIDYKFEMKCSHKKYLSRYRDKIAKNIRNNNAVIPDRIEKGGTKESERFE